MKKERLLAIFEDLVPLLISLAVYVVLILIFTGKYGFIMQDLTNQTKNSDILNQEYDKKVLGSVTSVGGKLTQNTIWTSKESPYELYTTIIIPKNIKLTIEPGVNIIRPTSGLMFDVQGILEVNGTKDNMVTIDGNGNSSIFRSDGSFSGGIIDLTYTEIKNGYKLFSNVWMSKTGAINISNCVFDNILQSSFITYPQGNIEITKSEFTNSAGFMILTDRESQVVFRNNQFIRQNTSLLPDQHYWFSNMGNYDQSKLIVEYNDFYTNEIVIKLSVGEMKHNISVVNNYWNTSIELEITKMIVDRNDDSFINTSLQIIPYLLSPYSITD